MKEATQRKEYSTELPLYLAFELAESKWKLGFSIGLAQPPRRRSIDARDLLALQDEIILAKRGFGLSERARPCEKCGQ